MDFKRYLKNDCLDLSPMDFPLRKEELQDLLRFLNRQEQYSVGHLIWHQQQKASRGSDMAHLVDKIEEKIIQNNLNYNEFPSDLEHLLLIIHARFCCKTNRFPKGKLKFDISEEEEELEDFLPYSKYNSHSDMLKNWKVMHVFETVDYFGLLYEKVITKNLVLVHHLLSSTAVHLSNHQQAAAYLATEFAVRIFKHHKSSSLSFTGLLFAAHLAETSVLYCHKDFDMATVRCVSFESCGSASSMEAFLNAGSTICTWKHRINLSHFDIRAYLSSRPNLFNCCDRHVNKLYCFKMEESQVPESLVVKYLAAHGVKQDFFRKKLKRNRFVEYGLMRLVNDESLLHKFFQALEQNHVQRVPSESCWPYMSLINTADEEKEKQPVATKKKRAAKTMREHDIVVEQKELKEAFDRALEKLVDFEFTSVVNKNFDFIIKNLSQLVETLKLIDKKFASIPSPVEEHFSLVMLKQKKLTLKFCQNYHQTNLLEASNFDTTLINDRDLSNIIVPKCANRNRLLYKQLKLLKEDFLNHQHDKCKIWLSRLAKFNVGTVLSRFPKTQQKPPSYWNLEFYNQDFLRRDALLTQIEEAFRASQCVILHSAQSCTGKSTLVREFSRECQNWFVLQIDDLDEIFNALKSFADVREEESEDGDSFAIKYYLNKIQLKLAQKNEHLLLLFDGNIETEKEFIKLKKQLTMKYSNIKIIITTRGDFGDECECKKIRVDNFSEIEVDMYLRHKKQAERSIRLIIDSLRQAQMSQDVSPFLLDKIIFPSLVKGEYSLNRVFEKLLANRSILDMQLERLNYLRAIELEALFYLNYMNKCHENLLHCLLDVNKREFKKILSTLTQEGFVQVFQHKLRIYPFLQFHINEFIVERFGDHTKLRESEKKMEKIISTVYKLHNDREMHTHAMKLYSELGNFYLNCEYALLLSMIGLFKLDKFGHAQENLEFQTRALEILVKIEEINNAEMHTNAYHTLSRDISTVLVRVGNACVTLGARENLDKAIECYQQAYNYNYDNKSEILEKIGHAYDLYKTFEHVKKGLSYKQRALNNEHDERAAALLLDIALNSYFCMWKLNHDGDYVYQKSLSYVRQSEDLYKAIYREDEEADVYHPALADVYFRVGECLQDGVSSIEVLKEALKWYERALVIYKHFEDNSRIAQVLGSIGLIYVKLDYVDIGLVKLKEALLFVPPDVELARLYEKLGFSCQVKQEYKQAVYYYRNALEIYSNLYTDKNKNVVECQKEIHALSNND